ncbi:HemK family protein methyltransferase [Nonomuraea sp. NPDC050691]|uniref:HemK family protein methyltransferase n=1 Tax=Nonomuraea sp. NPDC050691 TaxID=3155661 RepID=UPI0033ECF36B
MSVSPFPPPSFPLSLSAVTARLRAAGCVFAEDEAELLTSTARTAADLAAMVDRRVAGLPLEHVLGWAEFCGLRVTIDPGVFVPRRRSEFLAAQAIDLARRTLTDGSGGPPAGRPVVVVDLCCGSGALGAAVAAALSAPAEPAPNEPVPTEPVPAEFAPGAEERVARAPVEVHGVDIDPVAVRCARRNLAPAGGHVHQGDLYEPLPDRLRGRVGVLLASPPYVPSGAIGLLPAEAREHEPLLALDGGADGLDIVRRVIAGAPLWLAPGGHLLVETSERQATNTAEAMSRAGLTPRVTSSDELYATVVIGTMARG